jgi:TIR domain
MEHSNTLQADRWTHCEVAFMAVKIFFCYAHEDESLLKKLKSHLRSLQRGGLIKVWHDRDISAGTEWEQEIKAQLNTAQIILLLVSPDFMDSDYCYGIEMQRAMERHERGDAWVIPVILRRVYWEGAPFGKLQALPTDAKPITSHEWQSQDDAFYDVAKGIREAIEHLTTKANVKERVQLDLTPEALQQLDKSKMTSGTSTRVQILRETIPPYISGLHSTKPSLFLNSFSQALDYQDVQNVELHTHIQHFVATCDENVIRPFSSGQREYGWKDIRELMVADKLEFDFPQYAQRNPPLSGARANLPYTGNFYVLGYVDNKGFVLPISHFVGAVFVFTCVTCGSESTWAWKSVYICG